MCAEWNTMILQLFQSRIVQNMETKKYVSFPHERTKVRFKINISYVLWWFKYYIIYYIEWRLDKNVHLVYLFGCLFDNWSDGKVQSKIIQLYSGQLVEMLFYNRTKPCDETVNKNYIALMFLFKRSVACIRLALKVALSKINNNNNKRGSCSVSRPDTVLLMFCHHCKGFFFFLWLISFFSFIRSSSCLSICVLQYLFDCQTFSVHSHFLSSSLLCYFTSYFPLPLFSLQNYISKLFPTITSRLTFSPFFFFCHETTMYSLSLQNMTEDLLVVVFMWAKFPVKNLAAS